MFFKVIFNPVIQRGKKEERQRLIEKQGDTEGENQAIETERKNPKEIVIKTEWWLEKCIDNRKGKSLETFCKIVFNINCYFLKRQWMSVIYTKKLFAKACTESRLRGKQSVSI